VSDINGDNEFESQKVHNDKSNISWNYICKADIHLLTLNIHTYIIS